MNALVNINGIGKKTDQNDTHIDKIELVKLVVLYIYIYIFVKKVYILHHLHFKSSPSCLECYMDFKMYWNSVQGHPGNTTIYKH